MIFTQFNQFKNYRIYLGAVAIISGICTAFSLVLQYRWGFDPCVMCISQRMGILFAGLVALFCLLLPQQKKIIRFISAASVSVPAAYALWTAISQLHLQSLPPEMQPSCGAYWTFRLRNWWGFEWFEPLIRGFGQCGVVERFLGVPFALWSALACLLILLILCSGLYLSHQKR